MQPFENSATSSTAASVRHHDTLASLPARAAERCPERTAYAILDDQLEVSESLTFAELAVTADKLAATLADRASPGDPVLLAFNNSLAAIQAFWGCLLAGLVPVPAPAPDSTHSRSSLQRLAGIAEDAHITLGITHDDALADAREQLGNLRWESVSDLLAQPQDDSDIRAAEASPDEVAYLQYTSGSTSKPRAVELTHAAVLAQCRALDEAVAVDHERDRALIWLPWFHDYGLLHALILPVYEACPSYVMPTLSFMRQPLRWLTAIGKYRITHTGAPNFAYDACTRALARSRNWAGRLDTLRIASCGAEPVRRRTLDDFRAAFSEYGLSPRALAPSYGLAEAVLVVSLSRSGGGPGYLHVRSRALEQHRVEPAPGDATDVTELVSCGTPLPGFEVRIVDPDTCRPCDESAVGEIWVSGPSIGRGYRDQPDATDALFRARLNDDTERLYLRTGDLGFLHQGELFITGRRKDLLVVHGRNLYPQDLEEAAEAAHDSVRPAGAIAFGVTRDDGQECAVVLLECKGRPQPDVVAEITAAVRGSIAAGFELDVADVVPLRSGSLPRTSSGKPQRSAAAKLYLDDGFSERRLAAEAEPAFDAVTMRDAVLELVLSTWAEVLDRPMPAIDADFFEQGGDSLLATQIVSRLNAQLNIELPVRALFEARRPDVLAQLARDAETSEVHPAASAGDAAAPRQLSFTQERMWFIHQLAPESPAYNVPVALRFRGSVDTAAMQQAIAQVVARHQVLQTRFASTAAGPRAQVQSGMVPPVLKEVDVSDSGPASLEVAAGMLGDLTSEPFDLDAPPLIRVCLVRLGPEDSLLLWVMHHIIGDQWSCAVLGHELAVGYREALEGTVAALPPLPLQYADYADWQREWFSGDRRQQQLDYWRAQLSGLEPLQLNEDFPRSRQQNFSGAAVRRTLDSERLQQLSELAARHGVSLSMLKIAALKVLLLRHTGTSDIAIGVPVANRHHLSTENLVGSFVNTLVFRADLAGEPDFAEVLRRVREIALQAFEHQDMPFELLVRELELPPDLSRSPLFDVMFNMINTPVRDTLFPGLEWSRFDFDRRAAQFDLTVNVDALYDPSIVFEYATGLFARESVERLADQYLALLDAVLLQPAVAVTDIDYIPAAERSRLRQWGEGRAAADADGMASISAQIAARAERNPEAPALMFGDDTLTYAELDAAANRLATELRRRGMGRGHMVGVCLPRSPRMVEALIAVLRSGAAYVPLDPAYPHERLRFQAQDAGIDLLLADARTAGYLDWPEAGTLVPERESGRLAKHTGAPPSDPELDAGPEDPAYMIYTSGSTGTPKGVRVPHRAVVNFLDSMRREPGLSEGDRLLAVTTLGFDIAVLELLLPLTSGACVVLASDTEAASGQALADLIAAREVTVMQATPSRWHMLVEAGWEGVPRLKALVGGEPLSPALAAKLLERCGELWNMYGPTETTVWSSCWRVPAGAIEPVSLGGPVTGTTLQVVDERGRLCPIGVPGELCIGGAGLTQGYVNQPDLTAQQFVTAGSDAAFPGATVYRTGDRARWRHDGRLEHLGRFDDQVKLRGYRIEPGEIQARLAAHPRVAQAHVAVRDDAGGEPRLIAYVVSRDEGADDNIWRAHLRQWLPEHMVPRYFLRLDELPVLANGKIDRSALPLPDFADDLQPQSRGSDEEPRRLIEHVLLRIWNEALERDDVGIHDNFFDIGGHSLVAVTVVQRVQTEIGVECPLPLLFHSPTIAELAAVLDAGIVPEAEVAVRRLTRGTGPALFCLSGTEQYRKIAEQLSAGTPVYGLLSAPEAALLEHGEALPPVTELAAAYVDAIRRLQPHGPYRITGYSIGGIIAFEVALQLRAAGEEVDVLALLDCALPGLSPAHVWRWLKRRVLQVTVYAGVYLRRALERARARAAGELGVGSDVYPEYARITRQYAPGRWEGPVLFVQAEADPITEPGYGWQEHAPELRVLRVPGDHMDILQGSAVTDVAANLQALFDNAREGSPANAQLRYSSSVESP